MPSFTLDSLNARGSRNFPKLNDDVDAASPMTPDKPVASGQGYSILDQTEH